MTMEMDVTHSSHQDVDLIDILWEQDIDLGARREVFDYHHRQKECEQRRQLELQEQKRLQLLREKEQALLAQLQLDEETGEYVPRPPPPPPTAAAAGGQVQDVGFPDGSGDPMSFDECLQLLAETFPAEESENPPTCLDPAVVSMMSPGPPSTLCPPTQTTSPDLEQTWMEILSLPELQNCLNLPIDDPLEAAAYPLANSPDEPSPDYTFYDISSLGEGGGPAAATADAVSDCPADFMSTFDACVPSAAPEPGDLGPDAEALGGLFYADGAALEEGAGQRGLDGSDSDAGGPPLAPADLYSLSPGDALDGDDPGEPPESDSGISSHTSPGASSPGLWASGGGSCHYSDSEEGEEEMEQNPGSAGSVHLEAFALDLPHNDLFTLQTAPESAEAAGASPLGALEEAELSDAPGDTPFAKDKLRRRRADARLSRDAARASALRIPLGVDAIINLPVDDFNELMAKHRLSEAQLALVRDIRRRGKNKVAAQNCRKRKMESIAGLEGELDALRGQRQQLLAERRRRAAALRQLRRRLSDLYRQVFGALRDESGRAYSPADYSLQQSSDGSVFLVPRVRRAQQQQAGAPTAST